MVEMVIKNIQESIRLKTELLDNEEIINNSNMIAEKIIECYKNGNKV
jgi:phosphoheptose isomerase